MDEPPLQILPYGRDAADQAKLDAKAAGNKARATFGCFAWLILFALIAVFCWGWSLGVNTSLEVSPHNGAVTKRSESNG